MTQCNASTNLYITFVCLGMLSHLVVWVTFWKWVEWVTVSLTFATVLHAAALTLCHALLVTNVCLLSLSLSLSCCHIAQLNMRNICFGSSSNQLIFFFTSPVAHAQLISEGNKSVEWVCMGNYFELVLRTRWVVLIINEKLQILLP